MAPVLVLLLGQLPSHHPAVCWPGARCICTAFWVTAAAAASPAGLAEQKKVWSDLSLKVSLWESESPKQCGEVSGNVSGGCIWCCKRLWMVACMQQQQTIGGGLLFAACAG